MKEKTMYECEICGSVFENKGEARSCEAKHNVPIRVVRDNLMYDLHGYPCRVKVTFGNGRTMLYEMLDKDKMIGE